MLYRFPPKSIDPNDLSFLSGPSEHYAKLKIEAKGGQRTVLITEHMLIFVIQGIKLLHLSGGNTVEVSDDSVFLLKKGIYVMAEYIEKELSFEALMVFLPQRLLRSFLMTITSKPNIGQAIEDCLIIPASPHLQDFKVQVRQYFEHRVFNYPALMPLKQQEVLVLLQSTAYRDKINTFLRLATREGQEELETVMSCYLFQPISIAEMASLANRSLATFKRDFQKRYLASPRQWINQRRLEHAKMLLENTDKPVAEISNECGFKSSSYFIQLFKIAYQSTPGSVRAKTAIY
jgi:AraC-like DNA-binding protein